MNNKKSQILNISILTLCILVSIGSLIALFVVGKAKLETVFPVAILLVLLFVPHFLVFIFQARCSDGLSIFYYIFVTACLVLGSGWRFYDFILFFDIYLHVTSGIILSVVAYSMLYHFQKERVDMFSPVVVFLFCLGFASFIGVVWEIIEFSIDSVAGMNMQIYMTPEGVILSGQEVIYDTMKDLISNTVGGVLTSLYLVHHSQKYNRVPKLLSIKKIKPGTNPI